MSQIPGSWEDDDHNLMETDDSEDDDFVIPTESEDQDQDDEIEVDEDDEDEDEDDGTPAGGSLQIAYDGSSFSLFFGSNSRFGPEIGLCIIQPLRGRSS